MKSYSYTIKENPESYAFARVEGVDASFKDLSEVCGRLNNLAVERALELLDKFSTGEFPVLYKSHNKKLGHRRELGGAKGRYPIKAAKIVMKLLKSVIANANTRGLIEPYLIVHLSANKKMNYPRMSPKGMRKKSDYETARVEIVIREKDIVKKEKKKDVPKQEVKTEKTEEKKPEIEKEIKKVKGEN
ncbi:MAG: 50S ribosomal protein L22 [Candidatus ainarchaeum sp.]|nr:50S ribosomal protein L22 [Candidatus ainarchaeum sp.]